MIIMKFRFGYRSIDSFIIVFRLLLFNDKNIDIRLRTCHDKYIAYIFDIIAICLSSPLYWFYCHVLWSCVS